MRMQTCATHLSCTSLLQMRQYRKDISELLRTGKQDYARIRVEAVIREQLTLTGDGSVI